MTSVVGTFETCRRTMKMSAYRGRPEVGGARPRRVLWPPTDRRSLDALVRVAGQQFRGGGVEDADLPTGLRWETPKNSGSFVVTQMKFASQLAKRLKRASAFACARRMGVSGATRLRVCAHVMQGVCIGAV